MSAVARQRVTVPVAVRGRLRTRRAIENVGRYAVLLLILAFAMFPFVWTLAISLTDKSAMGGVSIYDFPASLFPKGVTLGNYVSVIERLSLGKNFLNSLSISLMSIVGTVLVSALAGYPLARFEFPGKSLVLGLIIATMVLPSETNFIVNVITLQKLHLIGSHVGVVLPTVATAVGIFLMRQAFLTVPHSLLEAARLDGATETQVLRHVMIPLSVPAMAALAIFTLVTSWNQYFWPMLVLGTRPDLAPMSVAIQSLRGQFSYDPFNIAAGAVIMMLPILLLFLFMQRYFMRGLEGAVK